jgi:hypothetical protein
MLRPRLSIKPNNLTVYIFPLSDKVSSALLKFLPYYFNMDYSYALHFYKFGRE